MNCLCFIAAPGFLLLGFRCLLRLLRSDRTEGEGNLKCCVLVCLAKLINKISHDLKLQCLRYVLCVEMSV